MSSESKAAMYKPPAQAGPRADGVLDRPSVIMFGNMEKGAPMNWREKLTASLSDMPIAILDPTNPNWDSTWIEDISFPPFAEQVEWEMHYAEKADVIAFHFAPDTNAPVSLLELGMYAGLGRGVGVGAGGKSIVVCCHPKFKKRGNVQMVCKKYEIELVESLEDLEREVRKRLQEKIEVWGEV